MRTTTNSISITQEETFRLWKKTRKKQIHHQSTLKQTNKKENLISTRNRMTLKNPKYQNKSLNFSHNSHELEKITVLEDSNET